MTTPTLRELKDRAQKLKPVIHIGHEGITDALVAALDTALADHGLVKVRFTALKDARRQLSADLAAKAGAHIVLQVGHTVSLYRTPATA